MSRPGLSLTEVLVATVLLAVGIGCTLGALATSLRMRNGASAREMLAAVAHDRLTWFERAGCAVQDTIIEEAAPRDAGIAESWRVEGEPGAVTLRGEARGARAGLSFAITVQTRRACE